MNRRAVPRREFLKFGAGALGGVLGAGRTLLMAGHEKDMLWQDFEEETNDDDNNNRGGSSNPEPDPMN